MPRCGRVSWADEGPFLSIFAKKKIALAVALCGLLPGGAAAQGLTCVAVEQCRGDAERMCAPSSLSIVAERRDAWVDMWIDRQGPYGAELVRGASETRLSLPLFRGHEMIVQADGAFLYRGNRGKRYTGRCEGEL